MIAPAAPLPSLWPREHGALPQLLLALASGLVAAHGALPSSLLAVAATSVLLAHEPTLVLLGQRGPRRLALDRARVTRRVAWLACVALVSGTTGLLLAPQATLPAAVLSIMIGAVLLPFLRVRKEGTTAGEVVAAVALAGTSLPVAVAGGASWRVAFGIASSWSLGMVVATLAVRIVLARATGRPEWALRLGVVGGVAALVGLGVTGVIPAGFALSATPLALVGVLVSTRPPPARRLTAAGFGIAAAGLITFIVQVFVLASGRG